jgi:hypothetical protein
VQNVEVCADRQVPHADHQTAPNQAARRADEGSAASNPDRMFMRHRAKRERTDLPLRAGQLSSP